VDALVILMMNQIKSPVLKGGEKMNEILINIGMPVLTALLAFIAATHKSKIDLKKQKEINDTEIKKIKESHECAVKLYQKNAEVDTYTKMVVDMINNPYKVDNIEKAMNKIIKLNSNKFLNKINK